MRKIRIGVICHMTNAKRIFQELLKGYSGTYITSKFNYETAYAETPLVIIEGISIVNYENKLRSKRYDVIYAQNGALTTENYKVVETYAHVIEL